MELIRKLKIILIVLSVVGILISIYLVSNHYNTGGSVCDISKTISCSLANGSIYSKFAGIPVSILGLAWFAVVAYLAMQLRGKTQTTIPLLMAWSFMGLGAIFYFIYAEISVRALCLACTAAHLLILIILGISWKLWKAEPAKETLWMSIKREKLAIFLFIIVMIIILLAFNWKYWFVY
ncbi:vitamin K epoxide reductase family protein [Candidatus Woesearchaeota archaeon]|nr:vitamin K epoxide reductase family protein [Candidatus Woesearchaeota archaeon]